MPVSDFLVSLALAVHPQGDARLPLTLTSAAVSQPAGGVAPLTVPHANKKTTVVGTTTQLNCATGKHIPKAEIHSRKAGPDPTVQAVPGAMNFPKVAAVTPATPQKCPSGEQLQKW
jgi:hypothetical protein